MPASPSQGYQPSRQDKAERDDRQAPIDECMAERGGLAALPLTQAAIGCANSQLMLGLSLKAKASVSAANVNRVLEVGY
jgi:hypothetical protein